MTHKKEVLKNLYKQHIKGTASKAVVNEITASICRVTNTVGRCVNNHVVCGHKVHITTRALKHLYDKKPAEEFDFIVDNLHKVVKYPDNIYKNKNPKRGNLCFTKTLNGNIYFCSLEVSEEEMYVVTCFRIRKESYLNDYELLWSWRDDNPSS
jgi:hypothetical protein